MYRLLAILFMFLPLPRLLAQGHLDEKISLTLHQKPLSQALKEIGRKGNFYFSYNTSILKGDSLVNVNETNKSVRQILDGLLGEAYDYRESGRYIILLLKTAPPPSRIYMVSGMIRDGNSNEKLPDVSVYESGQLVSALTDTNGFFRLKLKDKYAIATIVISKRFYRDTLLLVQPGHDQQVSLSIIRAPVDELSPFVVTNRMAKSFWSRFFLSSRQLVQSMNLLDFCAKKHIQFSLTPGLGTHGRMSGQVVDKLSLNAIGGYTGGVNGLEMGGVFNIDQQDVKYVQAAGVFNVAGGFVRGLQMAGIHNHDLDTMHGVQAAGISNIVVGAFSGVELSGIFNYAGQTVRGVQAAGIINHDPDTVNGVQLAGIGSIVMGSFSGLQAGGLFNYVKGNIRGAQISGMLNYTRKLTGLQIGLINIADTSDGYMIGLVNIVKHGIHELTVSSNEMLPLTVSYKAGSRKLYSIFLAGCSTGANNQAYSVGFGIGNELQLSRTVSLTDEFYTQQFYLGSWKTVPSVFRFQPSLQIRAGRKISFFAGPAFSWYAPHTLHPATGYKTLLPGTGYHTFSMGNSRAWLGWTVGINFF